ncbi:MULTISPECIES: LysR family transcriptional regulator [Arthrobacter]|uniref:LysR family transcriptional regulator n=1 Tax=Arthrobacter caoxuetaonis TaxID=2886935 RepID=A0A9X1ME70_9MICC|nr:MULTISPECIES: LysR family transcriptional regulator [Arthrobacter]MCC3283267.1 LysR family transcriptional regulator [Arthrobacter caoxuetaonis]MCC3298389.1 LysR family transcriptional regulator [Arthrobacter caoxuetaonis]MCC9195149.1 LysR family transcriptional regulator [Arthrobacter sp. zg-Y916]USQ57595.1 LysR family transcriptional regulator [Arthrobacter caoxuetaonis]
MKSIDLNLLPTLQILLRLRNVSRTAEHLQLSQPATSAALSRLRRYFDDELLVRDGRHYELTPLAQDLVPLVDDALQSLDRVTGIRTQFNPLTSDREFFIAGSDYAATMFAEPLRRILQVEAPEVSVNIIPTSGMRLDQADFTRCDLIVGPAGYSLPGQSKPVFRDSFVAVMDSHSPFLEREVLRVEDLGDLPHAVGYFGESIKTPADLFFESLGVERKIAAHVSGFLALPLLVEGTDLVALVPKMLALRTQRGADITIIEFPVESEPVLIEAMFWHSSRTEDPANLWLRSVVQRACAQLHQKLEDDAVIRSATISRPTR